jgi:transposase
MPRLLLIGGFNGCGYTVSCIRAQEKPNEWILPFVNNELFERVLKDFAQHFKIGKKKRVVLVMDGAGWHLSKSVKIPKGIHLCCLPSHSPELQPAERLWPLTNEPIANRYFSSLDEVPSCFIPTVSKTLRSQTINLRFDSWTVVAGTKSFINVRP